MAAIVKTTWKSRMSLQTVRSMDVFQEIPQPPIVYHMTERKNVDSIIKDGKIRTFEDYLCYFFPDLDSVSVYIDVTGALHGRQSYGFDGMVHTLPPLSIDDTVILKIKPRRKEPLQWFREIHTESDMKKQPEEAQKVVAAFDNSRICHYDDMAFRTYPVDIELIELRDVYKPTEWARPHDND